MDKTEQTKFDEKLREREIKRLTSSFIYAGENVYDIEGNLLHYKETSTGRKYFLEPKEGLLTDEDILKYAWDSEAASKVRLKMGMNRFEDKTNLYGENLFMYWLVFLCPWGILLVGFGFAFHYILLIIFAIITICLAYYTVYVLFLKDYTSEEYKNKLPTKKEEVKPKTIDKKEEIGLTPITNSPTLKRYETQVNDLKDLYEVKERIAVEMIEKRFSPKELTYDKFIATLKSCSNLFYDEVDSTLNIINFATDNTPKVEYEIKNRIDILKLLIEKVDELTNELVINMSSLENNSEEIRYLVEDMEKLIKSVKEYK